MMLYDLKFAKVNKVGKKMGRGLRATNTWEICGIYM